MNTGKPLSIYVHIPFCSSKCIYCDFASYPGRESDWIRYVDAVIGELESWSPRLSEHEVSTVFIGGGTPSLIPAGEIARILNAIRRFTNVLPSAEITMEGNPGTLTAEKLRIWRNAGVNRLSLGAQSFDDAELKALGRIHTAAQTAEAVEMARSAGFENLSLDLMYGLPGQTAESWEQTLRAATALELEHLSAYSLIVEEGTPLFGQVDRGEVVPPDDDATVEMQRRAIDVLEYFGYHRYEISNYARPGKECRHNIVYWERGEYLGVGCAAHSLIDGVRFENPRALDAYLAGVRRIDAQTLTREDAIEETIMLSTRMCRGMDLAAYRREFGVDFVESRRDVVERLTRLGLVECTQNFLRLTQNGLELHNAVVVELLTNPSGLSLASGGSGDAVP